MVMELILQLVELVVVVMHLELLMELALNYLKLNQIQARQDLQNLEVLLM